jgi:hypothetical protein
LHHLAQVEIPDLFINAYCHTRPEKPMFFVRPESALNRHAGVMKS